MKFFLLVICLLLSTPITLSMDIVTNIEINGLWRTREEIVYRELMFDKNSVVTDSQISESIKNLQNLLLFSSVSIEKIIKEDELTIQINLIEKWTVIPIFKAGGGGGINYLNIGAYDINSFGRYLELGGQYERLGDTNSGVIWFRYPKIFNTTIKLGGDLWYNNKNHLTYSGLENIGGYSHNKIRSHLFLEYRYTNSIMFAGGLDFNHDNYSEETLPQDILIQNRSNSKTLPESSTHLIPYIYLVLGELNYKNHLINGIHWECKISPGISLLEENFVKLESRLHYFKLLPKRCGNIGFQLKTAYSTSEFIHNIFYLGGLDAIRGFYHEQFLTDRYLQLNLEYRLESIKTEWFVLQHVLFTDLGYVGESHQPYISYGTGIRLISPRVYRLNVRLDYSFVYSETGPGGLSFGLQHFF